MIRCLVALCAALLIVGHAGPARAREPVVVRLAPAADPRAQELALRLLAELRSSGFDVAVVAEETKKEGELATFAIEPGPPLTIVVRYWDPELGPSTAVVQASPASSLALLAAQALERARGALARGRPKKNAAARPPPKPVYRPDTASSPAPSWSFLVAPSLLFSPPGLSASFAPTVQVARAFGRPSVALSWMGPTFNGEIASFAGAASLRQEVLATRVLVDVTQGHRWAVLVVGMGMGAYHLVGSATATAPARASSKELWALWTEALLMPGFRVSEQVRVVGSFSAAWATPGPVVRLGAEDFRIGRPFLAFSFGPWVSL